MIHHYGGTSHAVFKTLTKSLFSSNLEPYEMQYSFINRIRQLVASIQTIGDKRITVLPIAPPHHHHHPHRLTTRNQCLELLEMIDVEFHTAFPLVQRCTSSNTIIDSIILLGIAQYSYLHRVAIDFRMHYCYIWWWWMDSSSLSSITYEVWWGYCARETVDTEHCCQPMYSLYQHTSRPSR